MKKTSYFIVIIFLLLYTAASISRDTAPGRLVIDLSNITNIDLISAHEIDTLNVEETCDVAYYLDEEFRRVRKVTHSDNAVYYLKLLNTHLCIYTLGIIDSRRIRYKDYIYESSEDIPLELFQSFLDEKYGRLH